MVTRVTSMLRSLNWQLAKRRAELTLIYCLLTQSIAGGLGAGHYAWVTLAVSLPVGWLVAWRVLS